MNTLILNTHILGAGFLLAVLVIAIFLLLHKPFARENLGSIRTVINIGAGAIIWQILTGAFLFSDRPQDFTTNILFWVKIGLFILDLILGLVLVNRKLRAVEKNESLHKVSRTSLITWTVINLVLTLVIIALSIMIAK